MTTGALPFPAGMYSALVFALRLLCREWRAGELRVLVAALVVAVAAVASVGFFTHRIELLLENQGGELLAADRVISSSGAIPGEWQIQARLKGLKTARTLTFLSVVSGRARMQLTEVKAVGPGYPLRGQLRIAQKPYGTDRPAATIPAPGTIWLEPRLFDALGVQVGDEVQVGILTLTVAAVLNYEPDRGAGLINLAPRLILNLADIPRSGLIQPGSRVNHRLLLAGPVPALVVFQNWLGPRLAPGVRLITPRDAGPELRVAFDRGAGFLSLAALVSVILAGVAVAIAAGKFSRRHYDTAALLRCLGATQSFISRVFACQLLFLGLAASIAGCLAGYLAQEGLAWLLGALVGGALPAPSWQPAVPALVIGLAALLGFGLPPLLALKRVPPIRVLRLGPEPPPTPVRGWSALAIVLVGLLMLRQGGDPKLTLWVLAGGLVTLALLYLLARALVSALGLLRGRVGVAWRFGLASIARRRSNSVVQVMAFGLGIMVLLLLTVVRSDLLTGWRSTLPPDAPNHFLVNIQPDEVTAMASFLREREVSENRLFPMVRGRLIGINGRTIVPGDYADPRVQRLLEREFNLSWAETLAKDNDIVAGQWITGRQRGLSVEQGLARSLDIRLGDRLTFLVADQTRAATVTSLRSVNWDSFRVNFFVLFPPGALHDMPATYITSFHLPPRSEGLLREMVRRFPSVTIIDVEAIMSRVRAVVDRMALAVEYVFAFSLAAGLAVLYAAIQASREERLFEGAVLRVLGASRRDLMLGLVTEFATLGLLAGLLATVVALAVGYVLAEQIFHLPYQPGPWLWVAGLAGGTIGVGLAGLAGTTAVFKQSPLQVLRRL